MCVWVSRSMLATELIEEQLREDGPVVENGGWMTVQFSSAPVMESKYFRGFCRSFVKLLVPAQDTRGFLIKVLEGQTLVSHDLHQPLLTGA